MQVRHNFGPENGPQHTAISTQKSGTTDFLPAAANGYAGTSENTRVQEPEASGPPADLVGGLRWWARHHNWDELNRYSNEIRFNRAFAKGVRTAVDELMAAGLVLLAMQIKGEFLRLQKAVGELDDSCFWRIDTEDKCLRFQEKKAQVSESLCDLAAMLESGQKTAVRDQTSEISGTDEGWITVSEAARLLKKSRGTISHWADIGKVRDNGKKKYQRRILKADVLLIKQEIEDNDAKKDADEERRDKWKMDRQL